MSMNIKLFTFLFLAAVCAIKTHGAAPWDTIVVGRQSEAEGLATLDLQRYLAQVTGTVPKRLEAGAWEAEPVPAVLLGAVANHPLLTKIPAANQDLGDQGYLLANATLSGCSVVVAAGQTGAGAVHAVYGLFRELGYGFFLGS